jgi:DNA-binding CsgD family transcriptional regulator
MERVRGRTGSAVQRELPEQWVAAVAELMARVDGEGFTPALVGALRQLVWSQRAIVHVYPRDRKPRVLFDDGGDDPGELGQGRMSLVGSYLLDPCERLCREGAGEGFFSSRDLLADAAEAGEAGDDEIRHVAYLVGVSDSTSLGLQLSRQRAAPPYTARDIALYRGVQLAVSAALRLHWRAWAQAHVPEAGVENQLFWQVECALDRFGSGILTRRECQVVRLLLRGNSTRSCAEQLGIATATAALHRKRAYAKLGVSSQGELFYSFLQSLPGSAGASQAAAGSGDAQDVLPRAVSGGP